MKPSTVIHIHTLNVHAPSPGVLLESIARAQPFQVASAPSGTVIDAATGLMWSKETNAIGKNWAEAKQAAADLRLGGFSDWRLPTRQELLTLVDDTRSDPAIDTDKFECESSWYWTSTPLASSPSDCAWGVGFDLGGANCGRRNGDGRVRAVRSVSAPAAGQ